MSTDRPDFTMSPNSMWVLPKDTDLADQPPEVTTAEPGQPGSLPPIAAAAQRVDAFLAWFGDGIVVDQETLDREHDEWGHVSVGDPCPTLYARDLEALRQFAATATTSEQWRIHNPDGPSYAINEDDPMAEHYTYLVAAQRDDSYPERRSATRTPPQLTPWERGDPDIEHRVGDDCERRNGMGAHHG